MGRTTVYNANLSKEWDSVSQQNRLLVRDFIDYCKANDRSATTIAQYESQLKIFFCWNYRDNADKFFIELRKRDFIRFLGWLRELGVSSNRVASLKSALSSLSNSIELLDEDLYPSFRNQLSNLEPVHKTPVRTKTILTEENISEGLKILIEKGEFQEACCLALAIASGIRRAELTRMKMSFFTSDHLVFGEKMYKTDPIKTKGRGSQGKIVEKYILKDVFQPYFDLWLKYREEHQIRTPWLFCIEKNGQYQPMTVNQMNTLAQHVGEAMGVDFYLHACRHLWTTNMQRAGIPDSVIAEVQSWESLDMVKRYSDIPTEERLSQYFNKKEGEE